LSNNQTAIERRYSSVLAEGCSAVPKPPWLKIRLPAHSSYFDVFDLLKKSRLNTICQSAKCPNISECWSARTATFLILGDTCTRGCGFCAVKKGLPLPPSAEEPQKVAEAVASLGLSYAVITSVTRDDLDDGGASLFARTIRAIKGRNPQAKVEALIPDFQGDEDALAAVIQAGPDVLNHNIETTEACYPRINRPRENYRRSLSVLAKAKDLGALTKSGLMLGLGEARQEIDRTLADLKSAGCDLLTIGQYLQPARNNPPVRQYYTPGEFEEIKIRALALGFEGVEAGPLVRSSYHARRMFHSRPQGGARTSCDT
jgi:lipoic acid synthetase